MDSALRPLLIRGQTHHLFTDAERDAAKPWRRKRAFEASIFDISLKPRVRPPQMKEPATIKLQSTHKNQETSLKLSEYLDRQKVAARIRGVMLSSRTAWIAIGQPLFNTIRKKSDTGPKKIRAKRNKACAPASMCSWFITKSVKRIAAMVIVARLNNEMRALKRVFGSIIRSN
jgi:hypothetical protein